MPMACLLFGFVPDLFHKHSEEIKDTTCTQLFVQTETAYDWRLGFCMGTLNCS